MRTKNLLLSAAAVVAGALSAQAQQNVYSVNVVGYVNVTIPANVNTLVATPLDGGTNDLNTLLGTLPNKSSIQIWNGTGYSGATKGGSPSVWTPNLTISPGTGFFVKTPSTAGIITNTFVGSVLVAPGASVTNALPTTYVLVGSPLPFADTLNGTNLGLAGLPNKSVVQVWNGTSYTGATKGGSPSVWTPDLPISVGQGFFLQSKTATNWVQTLPAN